MRFLIGSLVAGAAMWVLGFVFYGVLFGVGYSTAPEATQLAIQAALKALPESGTYYIPTGATPAMMKAYAAGPVAQVSYNASGFSMVDTVSFIAGYVQFAVVAAMLGWLAGGLGERASFGTRARVICGAAAVAVVYIHLADPIWYHSAWRNPVYKAVADFVIMAAGGLIMARWFLRRPAGSWR